MKTVYNLNVSSRFWNSINVAVQHAKGYENNVHCTDVNIRT